MHTDERTAPELMTIQEVAREWRQSEASVYRKVAAGKLRAVRLGDETSALRVPRSELERIYEMSTVGGFGSSSVDHPAERRETSEGAGQSSSSAHAGARRIGPC